MLLKKKIKNGQTTIGSWITMRDVSVAEIMVKAGFDWLAIDMEHSALNIAQCQELIRVTDLCGIPALVRVGSNDFLLIKQAMDAGATGVIVPMVNSRQDAQDAVSAVKYPPKGIRGVGLSRAQGYGTSFQEYRKWVDKESIVIVQIEHQKAVENIDEILSVKGIDALMVGPYDLSASLGVPGDFENKQMKKILKQIKSGAQKHGIRLGCHVVSSDKKLVDQKIKEGYTFVAYGVDFLFLGDKCREGLNSLKSIKET